MSFAPVPLTQANFQTYRQLGKTPEADTALMLVNNIRDNIQGSITPAEIIQASMGLLVATAFSIKADLVEATDASVTSGSPIVTTTADRFVIGDIGKVISVHHPTTKIVLVRGTISGYTNAKTVTVSANASATVSNCKILFGTDNTAAVSTFLDLCETENKTAFFPRGRYFVGLTGTKNYKPRVAGFSKQGTRFSMVPGTTGNNFMLTFEGTIGSTVSLTSDYGNGPTWGDASWKQFTASSVSGLKENDYLITGDDMPWWQSDKPLQKRGQGGLIDSVDAGTNTVVMKERAKFPYRTSRNAAYQKVTPIVDGFIIGLTIENPYSYYATGGKPDGAGSATGATGTTNGLIRIANARNIEIDVDFFYSDRAGLELENVHTVRGNLLGQYFTDCPALPSSSNPMVGYIGTVTLGCVNIDLHIVGNICRHAGTTDARDNRIGGPSNVVFSGTCVGATNASWDCHAGGYNVFWIGCSSQDATGAGFQLRCEFAVILGGSSNNDGSGVKVTGRGANKQIIGLTISNVCSGTSTGTTNQANGHAIPIDHYYSAYNLMVLGCLIQDIGKAGIVWVSGSESYTAPVGGNPETIDYYDKIVGIAERATISYNTFRNMGKELPAANQDKACVSVRTNQPGNINMLYNTAIDDQEVRTTGYFADGFNNGTGGAYFNTVLDGIGWKNNSANLTEAANVYGGAFHA